MSYCPKCGATLEDSVVSVNNVPEQYQPLSPWGFFGYGLLFSIPVVGFICLIIFSCKKSNLCRRNFARSYWIPYVIGIIVWIILLACGISFSSLIG